MNDLFCIIFMPVPATLIFFNNKTIYIELSKFLWSFILSLIAVATSLSHSKNNERHWPIWPLEDATR